MLLRDWEVRHCFGFDGTTGSCQFKSVVVTILWSGAVSVVALLIIDKVVGGLRVSNEEETWVWTKVLTEKPVTIPDATRTEVVTRL